jgi:hypothetical protein
MVHDSTSICSHFSTNNAPPSPSTASLLTKIESWMGAPMLRLTLSPLPASATFDEGLDVFAYTRQPFTQA